MASKIQGIPLNKAATPNTSTGSETPAVPSMQNTLNLSIIVIMKIRYLINITVVRGNSFMA